MTAGRSKMTLLYSNSAIDLCTKKAVSLEHKKCYNIVVIGKDLPDLQTLCLRYTSSAALIAYGGTSCRIRSILYCCNHCACTLPTYPDGFTSCCIAAPSSNLRKKG